MESSVEIFQKIKNRPSILSSHTTPGHMPKEMSARIQQRYSHTRVYCNTIHNSQALERAQCPTTDEWVKKMWHVNIMEYYLAIEGIKLCCLQVSRWN
jgi:hypothetical protein